MDGSGADGDFASLSRQRAPWAREKLGRDAQAALRAHPRFGEALVRVAAGLTGHYAGNRLLNRLLSDRGRVVMGLFILYLDALPREAGGGLTAARLVALCTQTQLCSRGRVKALLALMRWAGFVLPAGAVEDRRSKPLVPDERLWVMQNRRWHVIFDALAVIEPEAARLAARLDDPGFARLTVIALGDAYCIGHRVVERGTALDALVEYDGALMVLLTLLVCEECGLEPEPIAELARRFHLSRAHVLKVLRKSEALGLLQRGARGGGVLSLNGREAVADFFAATFCLLLEAARQAEAAASAN